MSDPLLVVIGSGPGIGRSVATLFAKNGFSRVCLLSRSAGRLKEDEAAVREAAPGVNVTSHAVDITNQEALRGVLKKVEQHGRLECVQFNAARVEPSTLLETPAEDVMMDFQTTNIALYTIAQWAIPILRSHSTFCTTSSGPSFLVTSGLIWRDPLAPVFSLSMAKSAQRALVLCLNQTYGEEVHIALVYVGGVVGPQMKVLSPANIARTFWELHEERRDEWRKEVTLEEDE